MAGVIVMKASESARGNDVSDNVGVEYCRDWTKCTENRIAVSMTIPSAAPIAVESTIIVLSRACHTNHITQSHIMIIVDF